MIGLSGMVAIAAEGVGMYVEAFHAFAFLWQRDLASEYAKFMATHPQLEVAPAARAAAALLCARCPAGGRGMLLPM